MSMTKRLDGIEKQLNLKKESNCELEMTIGLTEDLETEAAYARIHPDGQRDEISYPEAQRLMSHDTRPCEVVVAD